MHSIPTTGLKLHRCTLALTLAATLAAAAPAFAQSTSSGVGGQVFSSQGQPVAGAEVTITHAESGTVSRTTTDGNGRYAARGLRVGGPYTITISKPGEGTRTEDNVYLALNQVGTVNATLSGDLTTLDTVAAVASHLGADVFSANKMGTGTNVTRESIEALPSATRNMQDFIRLDPRITQTSKADGAISAGGQNSRYNAIRIDGIGAGDPFGLEANGFPTERQPVSMDAIEEINIDLANYDTTIFGGTGAVINAVTRSGTNEYRGTVYYALRDGDWVRSRLRGEAFNGFDKEETYGFTFGGPIVKDRLFFFGNYERYVRAAPGASLTGTPYGRGDITDADINSIVTAARGFGVDPGGLTPPDQKAEIEEYALKIDWNINDHHRAAVRYNKMEQNTMIFLGINSNQISLSDYWYTLPKTYETWMGELFSDWGENFSTELKASYKDWSAIRNPSSPRPAIQIGGFPGNSFVNLGIERNTHANEIGSKELSLFAAANWYLTDHTIKFGADYSHNDINNFYGRDLYGTYEFSTLTDFLSARPNRYTVRTPRPGGSYDDIPTTFTLKNTGIFVQDTWAVNYNLNLMFGVRVDALGLSNQPRYNQLVDDIYGYNNTYIPDEKLIQPRFGFNYTFDSDRPMQLRGGVGLFGGSAPSVWLSEAYSNTGLNYAEYVCTGADAPDFSSSPEPNPGCSTGGSPLTNVSLIQPGFKLPSNWKSNLAFDHELPWHGIVASAEVLFTKVNDAIYIRRLDLYSDRDGNGATETAPDGRPLFWNDAGLNPANRGANGIDLGTNGVRTKANRPPGIGDVILVDNTSKGRGQQFTIGLDKPVLNSWGWSLFYTYTDAKEVSPLGNSQNATTWGFTPIGTVNENIAGNSRYAIRDRISGQLHWKKAFFGDYTTRVSVFYEGRSGRPFSYIFANDANGDATSVNGQGYSNDLFYVPSGPGDVLWTGDAAMEAQFFDWLAGQPGLSAYKGRIAPANAFRSGWSNTFDVRISQEFPGLFRRHKTELALDIMNIGNLLNKNWGLIEDYGTNAVSRVAHYAGIDPASGKYVYHFAQTPTGPGIQENNNEKGNTAVSRWSMMLSVKYRF